MKRPNLTALVAVICIPAMLAQGCAGPNVSNSKPGQIEIASDPTGATVFVDGSEIGSTPLRIVPAEVFRSGFVGLSYRYYGRLILKKPGCEEKVIEVNDAVLAGDVRVILECDPDYRPPKLDTPVGNPAESDQYADRLRRIERLFQQGLITEEEYNMLRSRVLDGL